MPYSDPEKKREYMKAYNPKYYAGNKQRVIPKNTQRKTDLRKRKKEYLLDSVSHVCPHCFSQEPLIIRYARSENLYDLSWKQLKLAKINGLIDIKCKTCHSQGTPEEHH